MFWNEFSWLLSLTVGEAAENHTPGTVIFAQDAPFPAVHRQDTEENGQVGKLSRNINTMFDTALRDEKMSTEVWGTQNGLRKIMKMSSPPYPLYTMDDLSLFIVSK